MPTANQAFTVCKHIGLALHNSLILDLHLPPLLYRRLARLERRPSDRSRRAPPPTTCRGALLAYTERAHDRPRARAQRR